MIPVRSGMRVWLSVGRTDMRRGMNGLSLQVQETLGRDPFAGDLFVFRGARGDRSAAASSGRRRLVAPSPYRPHSSPTCSTESTGVTRFTHSDRNARDSCVLAHFPQARGERL